MTQDYLTMDFNEIKLFVDYISNEILNIASPDIEKISSQEMIDLAGSNAEAAMNTDNGCIYILSKAEYNLLDFYKISHELRHVWQYSTDKDYYFNNYFLGMSEKDYNYHIAEIDANAFACIAIAIAFGIISRRNYTEDEKLQKIYEDHLRKLKIEFGIDF